MPGFFRRGQDEPPAPTDAAGDEQDAPDKLQQRLWSLVQFVNANAGKLPVDGVVLAREITDTVREVIATSGERELDVYAIVSINGIVSDYLPTTLRAYLALDPAATDRAGPNGHTPRSALREQLESLADAAQEMLQATHAHDVDALFSQGNFLRTKYTRSDLDL